MLARRLLVGTGVWPILASAALAQSPTGREIDAQVWTPTTEAVTRDDLAALGPLYHPVAVFVNSAGTTRIASKIKQWVDDAAAQKRQGIKSTVEFRFSRRQGDGASAFETGIFRYTQTDKSGVAKSRYIPFEALLIKESGRWMMLMERQLDGGTEAAWNALPR